jgi:hypothetical protein
LESFDILTEEEKHAALREAVRVKQAKLNLEEYTRKLKTPEVHEVITAEKFLEMVLRKAETEIKNFKLSPVELQIYTNLSYYYTGDERATEAGLDLKKGNLFFGGLGCGKTTAMKLFSNNPKQSYLVTSCRQVAKDHSKDGNIDKYFGMVPSQNPFATFGQRFLAISYDDLGTESLSKHFGNECNVMAEVFLSRYENEVLTHASTNLNGDEIEEFYGKRVRSRLREMFNVVVFPESITDKRQ